MLRNASKIFLIVVVGLMTAQGWHRSAEAAERSFSISPESLTVQGAASKGGTLNMPKSAQGGFVVVFVVPVDHAVNTPIKVRIYSSAAAPPCAASLRILAAARRRISRPEAISLHPSIDRMAPVGSEAISYLTDDDGDLVNGKTYLVQTPQSAPFTGLRAGDQISLRIERIVTEPSDTCAGFVIVRAVDVRYTVAP